MVRISDQLSAASPLPAVPAQTQQGAVPATASSAVQLTATKAVPTPLLNARRAFELLSPLAPAPASLPKRRKLRIRHWFVVLSLLLMVAIPTGISAWYLWNRAADQFASTVSFSVRQGQSTSAMSILGAIPGLSGSSSSDTDIIYDYINSQQLVAEVEAELKLSEIWSKPENDFVFAYDPNGTIEDLSNYWQNMVSVYYDSATRLIEIRVLAFDPVDARKITELIFKKSTILVNRLNDVYTEDRIRYATEDLASAEKLLGTARQAMTRFRTENQIIDPSSAVAGQSAVLHGLQEELVRARIDLGMIEGSRLPDSPSLSAAESRVRVIETQIEAEQERLGFGASGEPESAMVEIVARYEQLAADLTFAEGAYRAARAGFDLAHAEARRNTKYLAAHVPPSEAQSSRFPEREVILTLLTVFLFLAWSIMCLVYYAIRDRR